MLRRSGALGSALLRCVASSGARLPPAPRDAAIRPIQGFHARLLSSSPVVFDTELKRKHRERAARFNPGYDDRLQGEVGERARSHSLMHMHMHRHMHRH